MPAQKPARIPMPVATIFKSPPIPDFALTLRTNSGSLLQLLLAVEISQESHGGTEVCQLSDNESGQHEGDWNLKVMYENVS